MEMIFECFLTFLMFLTSFAIEGPGDCYNCQNRNIYVFVNKSAQKRGCQDFNCWSSQLKDQSRYVLENVFEEYNSMFALGTCRQCNGLKLAPLYKMYYHWLMEYLAVEVQKIVGCKLKQENIYWEPGNRLDAFPIEKLLTNIYLDELFKGQDSLLFYYCYASTTFKLEDGEFQEDAILKLEKALLRTEPGTPTVFEAWDRTKLYRLGPVFFFGCTLVIRDNVEGGTTAFGERLTSPSRVAYVNCVFTSLKKPMETKVMEQTLDDCEQYRLPPHFSRGLCDFGTTKQKSTPCQFYYNGRKNKSEAKCTDEDNEKYSWELDAAVGSYNDPTYKMCTHVITYEGDSSKESNHEFIETKYLKTVTTNNRTERPTTPTTTTTTTIMTTNRVDIQWPTYGHAPNNCRTDDPKIIRIIICLPPLQFWLLVSAILVISVSILFIITCNSCNRSS